MGDATLLLISCCLSHTLHSPLITQFALERESTVTLRFRSSTPDLSLFPQTTLVADTDPDQ
jgi:hypothetical protein